MARSFAFKVELSPQLAGPDFSSGKIVVQKLSR
jgi:hypothetical protein